jgi:archaellum component FlaC
MDYEVQIDMQEVADDLAEQLKNSIVMISALKSSLKQQSNKIQELYLEIHDLKNDVNHLEALVSGLAATTNPDTEN